MKKIITALLAAVTLSAVSAAAAADNAAVTCKDFTGFFDADELSVVIGQTAEDRYIKAIGYTAESPANENPTVGEYKEYMVSFDFLTELSKGTPLKDLLPDKYAWMIPSSRSVAKVVLKDGTWNAIGYSTPMTFENDEIADDSVRFDKINSALETLTLKNYEITDVVCVQIPSHCLSLVCIISDDSYAIPFSTRPDFTGLVNGELYSVSDTYDTLVRMMGDGKSAHNTAINSDQFTYAFRTLDISDGFVTLDINGMQVTVEDDPIVWRDLMREYGDVPAALTSDSALSAADNAANTSMPVLPIIIVPAAAIAIAITVMLLIGNKGSRKNTK